METPVTGVVWKVVAPPGTRVMAGNPVVIVESMKMEIPVETPVDGELLEIRVNEGDSIQEGQVLAVVEED